MYKFEWDPAKAASNVRKHGVSFENAGAVFQDPLMLPTPDEDHGGYEERWVTMGRAADDRLLAVCHTDPRTDGHKTSVRIISARLATRSERRQYESGE